jgi:hypothetical protein
MHTVSSLKQKGYTKTTIDQKFQVFQVCRDRDKSRKILQIPLGDPSHFLQRKWGRKMMGENILLTDGDEKRKIV